MKGYNVFLAVLIFLLAAVSAVFSYFLFEKRAQLVDGWNDMAAKIGETAAVLDGGSGTNVAGKLTKDAMHQTKFKDLRNLLPELSTQAKNVIKERNDLAEGLSQVARVLEKNNLPADKFQNMNSYASALAELGGYVNAYQTRTNTILRKVSQSATTLGADVSVEQLKSQGYGNAYDLIDERITYYLERDERFGRSLRNIASSADVAAPDLSPNGYVSGAESVVSGVQKMRSNYDDTRVKLQDANNNIDRLNQVVTEKNAQIDGLNALNAKKDAEIRSLRLAMGMDVEAPAPLQDGCVQSLRMIRDQQKGSITDIDDKFGFFVVSLGSKTTVEEQLGKFVSHVQPMIPEGSELVISRDMPGKDPEYIGKLKIVKLGELYSVAELVDNSSGKRPKVGDMVYFSDAEIEKIVKSRK